MFYITRPYTIRKETMSDHQSSINVLRLFEALNLLGVTRADVLYALRNPGVLRRVAAVLHTGPTVIDWKYPLIATAFQSDTLVRNALHRKGLYDMRELGLVTREQLSTARGFGPRMMNTVTETMALYELTFLDQSSRRAEVAQTIYYDVRDVPSWVVQAPDITGDIRSGDSRLNSYGMRTLGAVADMSREELGENDAFPPGLLDTYERILGEYGLSFRSSEQ